MTNTIPAEPVLLAGFVFGFLVAWLWKHERTEKIKDDAIREYIASQRGHDSQRGRIIPPRGGSGTAPPRGHQ